MLHCSAHTQAVVARCRLQCTRRARRSAQLVACTCCTASLPCRAIECLPAAWHRLFLRHGRHAATLDPRPMPRRWLPPQLPLRRGVRRTLLPHHAQPAQQQCQPPLLPLLRLPRPAPRPACDVRTPHVRCRCCACRSPATAQVLLRPQARLTRAPLPTVAATRTLLLPWRRRQREYAEPLPPQQRPRA